eukprot:3829698-Pyramimonas_sp.AAC.1
MSSSKPDAKDGSWDSEKGALTVGQKVKCSDLSWPQPQANRRGPAPWNLWLVHHPLKIVRK